MKKSFLVSFGIFAFVFACNKDSNKHDTDLPIVQCRDTTLYICECSPMTISAATLDNGSYDNVGIDTLWLDRYTFDCNDTSEIQQVTLHALDVNNNYASCISLVTVIDTTPKITIREDLAFTNLVYLIGGNPDNILNEAPGQLLIDTIKLGQREMSFLLEPSNIETYLLLGMNYSFINDELSNILFFDMSETDDREVVYQLSLVADGETWFTDSKFGLSYWIGFSKQTKIFQTVEEMWTFIASENISKSDIDVAIAQWSNFETFLLIGYSGGLDDIGLGGIEPLDKKKASINIERLFVKFKDYLSEV